MDIPTTKLFMENQTTKKYMDIQVKVWFNTEHPNSTVHKYVQIQI